MKTIWKYTLQLTDTQVLKIPLPATPIAAQLQGGALCLWAEVDPESAKANITIAVVGTGHPLPDGRYISTVQAGPLVWHIYEVL